MGVRTNAGGGASVSRLKTALQYADDRLGITVASSSYNDICTALADYFPYLPSGVLYDSGKSSIEWDNTGVYAYSSSYTPVGGVDFGASSFGFSNEVLSVSTNKVVFTQEAIDLTNYNSLYFGINGGSRTLDISSLSGSYYIGYSLIRYTNNSLYYTEVCVTTQKSYYANNVVKHIDILQGTSSTSDIDMPITYMALLT